MNIVVLTGAGVSQESGIPTFRAADGLWEGEQIADVATPEAFWRNPDKVHRFYNARRRLLQDPAVKPNAAHRALARLQRQWQGGEVLIVTQNVDDLHERAGSTGVLHMHGQLLTARCIDTGEVFAWRDDLGSDTPHPRDAQRRGRLRPNVVWFGEMPLELDRIQAALARCDIFIAVGTSGLVYPAAGFVACVSADCRTVELNLDETAVASAFKERRRGPATHLVPQFVDELLGQC